MRCKNIRYIGTLIYEQCAFSILYEYTYVLDILYDLLVGGKLPDYGHKKIEVMKLCKIKNSL